MRRLALAVAAAALQAPPKTHSPTRLAALPTTNRMALAGAFFGPKKGHRARSDISELNPAPHRHGGA